MTDLRLVPRLPALREIDLSRGDRHTHPDIVPGRHYMVRIYGAWHMGRFSEVWYGLSFSPWGNAGLQFDAPGYNLSAWERIIEVDFREDAIEPTPSSDDGVGDYGFCRECGAPMKIEVAAETHIVCTACGWVVA